MRGVPPARGAYRYQKRVYRYHKGEIDKARPFFIWENSEGEGLENERDIYVPLSTFDILC